VLLADDALPIGTVRDHIEAICMHSRHRIVVLNPRQFTRGWSLASTDFDALVIHYSISILFDSHLPPPLRDLVRRFNGPKIQIIQDEYRWVDRMTRMMAELEVKAVFSSLSIENLPRVYHHAHLSGVRFYSSLPGYVAERLLRIDVPRIQDRSYHLVYRGRELPPWFGQGAREKVRIGEQAQRMAERFGLFADIKLREEDRIYGSDWIRHLTSGKSVLAVEGGATVFDFDEGVEEGAKAYQAANPEASWEETWLHSVQAHENNIIHRTITPRVLESILCRTALVMYPGHFRGVLQPWKHYIPLERDGSNERDVVHYLRNDQYLQDLVDRTHTHIANNPELRYANYVRAIDVVVDNLQREYHQPIIKHIAKSLARPVRIRVESAIRHAELLKDRVDATSEKLKDQFDAVSDRLKYNTTRYWPAIVGYRIRRSLLPLVRVMRKGVPKILPPLINGNKYRSADALNVIFLCDYFDNRVASVRERLTAFANYSRNRVCFVNLRTLFRSDIDLDTFDCLAIYHSSRFLSAGKFDEVVEKKLREFAGPKLLLLDESSFSIDRLASVISRLGIDTIFAALTKAEGGELSHCVSKGGVRREVTLTGFVSERLLSARVPVYTRRRIDVGYCGGQSFSAISGSGRDDQACADMVRRKGLRWKSYFDGKGASDRKSVASFIVKCKAVFCTEHDVRSGDLDSDASLKSDIGHEKRYRRVVDVPDACAEPARGANLIRLIFDAAALRTLLILHPGQYWGIAEPWRHYVPLECDYRNLDEVLSIVRDPARAATIVENAYNEIAKNTAFSLGSMVQTFDNEMEMSVRVASPRRNNRDKNVESFNKSGIDNISRYLAICQLRSILLFLRYEYPLSVGPAISRRLTQGLLKAARFG
jgi:hypothetical protein